MLGRHPLILLALCLVGAASAQVSPLERVASLHDRARPPSIAAADAFGVNHTNPIFLLVATRAIEANRCLEACELHPCETFDSATGECAKKKDYCEPSCWATPNSHMCKKMPQGCYKKLTSLTLGERGNGPELVPAGAASLYTWAEGRLGVCKTCLRALFKRSQVIADLVTACQEVKTYANASGLFYDLELAPGMFSYTDSQMAPRLRMLLSRYPDAQRIISVMRSIRSSDFCNIFASKLMRGGAIGMDM